MRLWNGVTAFLYTQGESKAVPYPSKNHPSSKKASTQRPQCQYYIPKTNVVQDIVY